MSDDNLSALHCTVTQLSISNKTQIFDVTCGVVLQKYQTQKLKNLSSVIIGERERSKRCGEEGGYC